MRESGSEHLDPSENEVAEEETPSYQVIDWGGEEEVESPGNTQQEEFHSDYDQNQ